jgi:DNA-binding IclR family transcriptional regulator
MPSHSHRTIDRVTQILEVVAGRPEGCTLTELSTELDAPKSSIQGFVNGLVHTGYLDEHDRRYLLGPAPYMLTLRANRLPARTVGHDDLVALNEESGCTVLLGVRVGQHVVYVDDAGEGMYLQFIARTRARRPLLETAAGQVLLAALPEDELHRFLQRHPDHAAVERYLDTLPEIRKTGIAVNESSPVPKTSAVARQVRNGAGHVVASVTLSGRPEDVLTRVDELSAMLRAATDAWAGR